MAYLLPSIMDQIDAMSINEMIDFMQNPENRCLFHTEVGDYFLKVFLDKRLQYKTEWFKEICQTSIKNP